MGTYSNIQSSMSGPGNTALVIDIAVDQPDGGGGYYLYTNEMTGADTQLWEYVWVVEPPNGWCFIQSKWKDPSGNHVVIDIHKGSNEPRTRLDAHPRKSANNNNQLWQPVDDLEIYVFYKSKLKLTDPSGNFLVIDLKDKNTTPKAELIAFPKQSKDYVNQLWLYTS